MVKEQLFLGTDEVQIGDFKQYMKDGYTMQNFNLCAGVALFEREI